MAKKGEIKEKKIGNATIKYVLQEDEIEKEKLTQTQKLDLILEKLERAGF